MSDEHRKRIEQAIGNFYKKKQKDAGSFDEAWQGSGPKRKKRAKPEVPLERDEQVQLAKYLDSLKFLWCHVPNEGHGGYGKRAQIKGARLRAEGLKAGISDCLVFDHCTLTTDGEVTRYNGCAIELKRQKGGRVSDEQKYWLEELRGRGWYAAVCNGFLEAKELIERLGYAEKKVIEVTK